MGKLLKVQRYEPPGEARQAAIRDEKTGEVYARAFAPHINVEYKPPTLGARPPAEKPVQPAPGVEPAKPKRRRRKP